MCTYRAEAADGRGHDPAVAVPGREGGGRGRGPVPRGRGPGQGERQPTPVAVCVALPTRHTHTHAQILPRRSALCLSRKGECVGADTQSYLSLQMLRLLSSKTQGRKDFRKKTFKPCHVGIHWIGLTEYP